MAEAVGGGKMAPPAAGERPAAPSAKPPSVVGEGGLGPWSVTEGSVLEAAARAAGTVVEPEPCSHGGRGRAGHVKARGYPR